MVNTKRFRQLKAELARLRLHLLPSSWDPTNQYSDRKLDRTRAYTVLAHAEIEAYIEDVVLDIVKTHYQLYNQQQKFSYVILRLVVSSLGRWEDKETKELELSDVPLPSAKAVQNADDPAGEAIQRAFDQYHKIVKNNHGIKEVNLKRLLMPTGITIQQLNGLNPTWIANMNNFGAQRGDAAHRSRMGLKNIPDPRSEKQAVDDLVDGLKALDELLNLL